MQGPIQLLNSLKSILGKILQVQLVQYKDLFLTCVSGNAGMDLLSVFLTGLLSEARWPGLKKKVPKCSLKPVLGKLIMGGQDAGWKYKETKGNTNRKSICREIGNFGCFLRRSIVVLTSCTRGLVFLTFQDEPQAESGLGLGQDNHRGGHSAFTGPGGVNPRAGLEGSRGCVCRGLRGCQNSLFSNPRGVHYLYRKSKGG
jgi:hypothetical protein